MAYRPFHRAFGETSLELKCLFFFGLGLFVVIVVSSLLYWQIIKNLVHEQNPETGKLLANRALMVWHWDKLETSKNFAEAVDRVIGTPINENDTPVGTRPEDSYLIKRPQDGLIEIGGPHQPKSESEAQVLRQFMEIGGEEIAQQQKKLYEGHYVSNREEYHFYQPIWAKRSCLSLCHNSIPSSPGFDAETFGLELGSARKRYSEGDLMAVMKVIVPNDSTQDAINFYWSTLLALSIITAFLAMTAFYLTIRYVIVRPLRHLRQVSDAISHGEIAMRADIHTGDEFESLGVAFNRMLGHLVAAQDALRHVNVDLDGKVDELAQLNMQLYEMNRVKSDFLATMSHELRTPLNSILGFSDVLGAIDSLDDKQKRYVENIRKSGRMLLEMINNILDLAKIESGKMEPSPSKFPIAAVINAQCDMARPLVEKKNLELAADILPGLPPLYQDQARVQQILNNLLSNAIKFTPEGGRIRVSAQPSDSGDLLIRVSDTGVGIAEEDQQAIFEKFRQGRTAMPGGDAITREYSGTGLGLSIVQELCKLLEGEIHVQSELGTGSTFTVQLPWELTMNLRPETSLTDDFEEYGNLRLEAARQHLALPTPTQPPDDS